MGLEVAPEDPDRSLEGHAMLGRGKGKDGNLGKASNVAATLDAIKVTWVALKSGSQAIVGTWLYTSYFLFFIYSIKSLLLCYHTWLYCIVIIRFT